MSLVSGRVEIFDPEAARRSCAAMLRANRLVDLAAAHLMRQSMADPEGGRDYRAAYAWAEQELANREAA